MKIINDFGTDNFVDFFCIQFGSIFTSMMQISQLIILSI